MTGQPCPQWSVPLRLVRGAGRTVTGTSALLADPELRERTARYLTDLTGGPPVTPGSAPSFGETAAELVTALVDPDQPVDRLLLAFTAHDSLPGRATATYLSHICPGGPIAFAVGDQGPAAAFTALRLAGRGRSLVLILEPATLPYPTPTALATEHRAVALLLNPFGTNDISGTPTWAGRPEAGTGPGRPEAGTGPGRPEPGTGPGRPEPGTGPGIVGWTEAAVPVSAVPERASAAVAALSTEHAVILGAGLAAAWPDHPSRYHPVPVGQPLTGVWSALLDARTAGAGPVLVADYDPILRYLSAAAINPG